MSESLAKLAALPEETVVYCAHEYTQVNLRFAQTVEPGNRELQHRVEDVATARAEGRATIPSSIALEKATNPFLRCHVPEIIALVSDRGEDASDALAVFAALRQWRNAF